MTVETPLLVFVTGTFGGVLTELLHWWNLRTSSEFPEYAGSRAYWLLTIAMVFAGGVVAWLYFGSRAEGIVALHVGMSTPLLLQKLATSIPEKEGAREARMIVERRATVRNFFRW